MPLLTTIGLMSGTSLDGIDAALIRTDGRERVETGAFLTVPYPDELRARLRGCLGGQGPEAEIAAVGRALTDAHAEAVRALLTGAVIRICGAETPRAASFSRRAKPSVSGMR